ncbi:MAG: hypothetical protein KGH71_01670 [Candidatus Micrarchaeota archaeon]|nr:hypothetical protein [Candidatus Micrarchaeota archaeon]
MSKTIAMQKERHSPTLNTVIMVEDVIKGAKGSVITIPGIKRGLPKQVNHATLKVILEYLEESGKILFTSKGITWVQNANANLRSAVKRGMEI